MFKIGFWAQWWYQNDKTVSRISVWNSDCYVLVYKYIIYIERGVVEWLERSAFQLAAAYRSSSRHAGF